MRRHPELSLRSPEPTSLGRFRGFNRKDVDDFFDKLIELVDEHGLTPDRIYNVDETGHSTVHKPSKVVSVKGKRQVGGSYKCRTRTKHHWRVLCVSHRTFFGTYADF